MNKIFKETQKITLDDNYYLEPDQFKGLVLVFHEQRVREKKDGGTEGYEFEERYYFPKLSQTIRRYSELVLNASNDITDLLGRVERLEQVIHRL